VTSFIGRKDILDKLRRYFDSESASQRIFVLHGIGGAGKSQLAFKFIEESKDKRYNNWSNRITLLFTDDLTFPSFSDIFYVDATNEDTIQTDLEAVTPGNAKRTVEASLRWLASQTDRNWLLVFDNADNVDLKLRQYFPSCFSGNILVTTRNRDLRHYTAEDADAVVKDMDFEDAKALLLVQARATRSDEHIALAETIVKVVIFVNRRFCTNTP